MCDINSEAPNFVDKKDRRFSVLHKTLDFVFLEFRNTNVGTNIRNAEPFSAAEEEKLWSTVVLGTDTPKALLNAVFFTLMVIFFFT